MKNTWKSAFRNTFLNGNFSWSDLKPNIDVCGKHVNSDSEFWTFDNDLIFPPQFPSLYNKDVSSYY